jgi:manganese/iron transport system substrate-binding protein
MRILLKNSLNLAIATLAIMLTGCNNQNHSLTKLHNSQVLAQGKPKVVVSHSVLCDFMKTIAQDTIDLTCLIEGGQDPHAYRPTPSQRKALEEAQIIFYGGYDFETQVIPLIEAVDSSVPKLAVHEVVVTDPIMIEHHHHEGEHDHEAETTAENPEELTADPHIWHDVYNAIAMIEYLQSSLLQINPSQAALYLENSARLIEELKQLHVWIQEQITTIPEGKRVLVTTHDSLNYYVKAYELEQYKTLQGLSPDASPSASDLRNLVQEIKQTQVPTIFAETTANDRVINNVAREAGVKVSDRDLLVDSLGKAGTETDTYGKMMIYNTCAIVDGLGGHCKVSTDF